jgi:iron complex transport system substrate-binding protein
VSLLTVSSPAKIISFAPNITEILYSLGLNENIAGVTQFCNYPPEAARKNRIGGFASFNYEMILRLKPDLAIILKEERELAAFFEKYSIRYITVGSDSVDEIIESIETIAKICLVEDRGGALVQKLRSALESTPVMPADKNRPKVLLCVGRDNIGGGAAGKCFGAGASSFYNQLIEAAGGMNILADIKQAYPAISAEAVIRLNPDIIIDISSAYSDHNQQTACDDWKALKTVSAVKTERTHCLSGDYLTIPGPRFVLILDEFRRVVKN